MNGSKKKLKLDPLLTYEIRIPGHLHEQTLGWGDDVLISLGYDALGHPVSDLTVTVDQASLHGVLRRLYSLGIPLISVLNLDIREWR